MKLISGLAAVALAATTLAAAQPASAATPVPPTQLAADWSAGQLTDGLVMGQYGADVGLSIDAGLAFDALGRTADADRVADAIADRLVTSESNPYGYVASDEFDNDGNLVDGYYANATAKAAAFTQRVGRDAATAYPAVDLIAQLETLTGPDGVIADDSVFGTTRTPSARPSPPRRSPPRTPASLPLLPRPSWTSSARPATSASTSTRQRAPPTLPVSRPTPPPSSSCRCWSRVTPPPR